MLKVSICSTVSHHIHRGPYRINTHTQWPARILMHHTCPCPTVAQGVLKGVGSHEILSFAYICSASLNVSFALLQRRTSQNAFQNAQSLFNKPYMKILTDGPSSVILHISKKKLPLFYTLFLDHLLEHFQPSNTCLYSSPAV